MKKCEKTNAFSKKKVLLFILLFFSVTVMAQNITVKGTVVDALGESVIGASVQVKGATNGTITNLSGEFMLPNVKKGSLIQVSFIGYVTQTLKANGEFMKIILLEDSQTLQEVVVTGYGGVQKAKTMTAAASTVKMDQIAKLPVTTISEGLGGRVTGVVTQKSSGAPGEVTKIWIRGGSQILYVIDDVVMETAQGEVFFNRLRPDDIATMAILKDASATAIYGPRANDGVVVIQTKRGQDGAPKITIDQKVSIMSPSYRPKGMSSYDVAQTRNELAFASFQDPQFNNEELSKYYMGDLWQKGTGMEDIAGLVNGKYGTSYTTQDINNLFDPMKTQNNIRDSYCSYDPWDMFNHTQPMYQTNVNIRGGSDRVKYYSSLGYMNQKGVSSSFDYQQVNAILNTDAYLLKDKSLKFTLNINGSTANKKQPSGGEGIFRSAMYGGSMPSSPAIWSTGKAKKGSVASRLKTGFNNTEDYRVQLSSGLKWSIPWVEGLSASVNVNFNTSYSMNKQFSHDETEVYDRATATNFSPYETNNATVRQEWNNYKLLTGIYQLDYTRSFGKHNVAVMANYQSQTRNTNQTYAKAKGYPTTLTPQVGLGTTKLPGETGGSQTDWGSSSYIGRVTYDYANKYLLQYSANYNASLSYSPSIRWGFFQAVSAGWVLSEEKWFKSAISKNVVNMFKIRGGYGIVGGEIGAPFDYINQFAQNNDLRVLFGDMTPNVAWYESKVASQLSWSKSRQISGGVDFGLFNNRLNGSVDLFLYMNNGAAMDMNQALIRTDILGMPNTPQTNAPFETNRKGGYEITLNWNDVIGKVAYRVGGNFSFWDERVTRHTDKSTDWYYPSFDTAGYRELHPVYLSGYHVKGLSGSWDQIYNTAFSNAARSTLLGTFIMEDANGDGAINGGDYQVLDKPGTTPLTLYGITLGANWNGFDIEVFFQGATNVSGATPSPIRGNDNHYMWNYGQYAYQNSYMPSKNNTDAALPLPTTVNQSWGGNYNDWWTFDASYLKLKNISLRYDFKHSLLKNLKVINGLEASFVVSNAFTWTKKSYPLKGLQDPEFITSSGNMYGSNGSLGSYPTQRSFTFGITVTL